MSSRVPLLNGETQQTPVAQIVQDSVKCVQIPPNLRPGDSFTVTPADGTPTFTVLVPEGSHGGDFVNVAAPSETQSVQGQSPNERFKVDKAVAGAALVGGVVGLCVLGPIGGVILAGGAAFMATKKDSKVGQSVRKVGHTSYLTLARFCQGQELGGTENV